MDDNLSKYNWKKIDVASNISDDIWTKDKYVIIHGWYGSTFYLEEKIDGKLPSVNDPSRKTIKYNLRDLQEAVNYVELDIASRKEEIRDRKLIELGI
jgi:hypothetical protein